MMPEFELELDRVATGGAGIGRGPDGRVVFAIGGLPGERVLVKVVAEHRRRIETRVTKVIRSAPGRIEVACPHVAEGCGGCDWQHATVNTQQELRRDVVIDCLRRLARIDEPDVRLGPTLPATGYRTTVRAAVVAGRAGYRAAGSHRIVIAEQCLVTHPLIEELLVDGRFGSASEVTIRLGARTGERLVVSSPDANGVVVPDDVMVVGADEIDAGRIVAYHEVIDGHRLRISASSFFQCRPDGAEVLVNLVHSAIKDIDGPLLDAYCGVGLFGVCAAGDRAVLGIESHLWAARDAAANYEAGTVEQTKVERWQPRPFGVVVADPARVGLGKVATRILAATEAVVIVLVSCDPGSLARDAGLLIDLGYDLDHVTTVDLFGQTSHVETVSRFVRR